jgi:hypothetical protein
VSDFKIIPTTALVNLTEVRFYEDTVKHILEEHPEVPILLPTIHAGVTGAISNPTHIERSYAGSFVFVDTGSTNASGDPLRVPVMPVSGTSGRVRTVYFATPSGSPEVIWRRGS